MLKELSWVTLQQHRLFNPRTYSGKNVKSILVKKCRRVGSTIRPEHEAHLQDILHALDKRQKMPTVAICALQLHLIPRSHPEELNNVSLLDRLNQLEKKITNVQGFVQETTDRVFAENIAINDRLNKHFSYSSVAQSKTSVNPSANVLKAKKPVNIESHSKVGGMTHPPPVQRYKDLSTQSKIDN